MSNLEIDRPTADWAKVGMNYQDKEGEVLLVKQVVHNFFKPTFAISFGFEKLTSTAQLIGENARVTQNEI